MKRMTKEELGQAQTGWIDVERERDGECGEDGRRDVKDRQAPGTPAAPPACPGRAVNVRKGLPPHARRAGIGCPGPPASPDPARSGAGVAPGCGAPEPGAPGADRCPLGAGPLLFIEPAAKHGVCRSSQGRETGPPCS